MGNVHRYGDRRMPVAGAVGIIAATASAVLAAVAGRWAAAIWAATAVTLLPIWLALYTRISAPINRELSAAAKVGDTPPNARVLQEKWDRIINTRAVLQGLALVTLCLALTI
jgi:hypothetical protein